MYNLVFFAPDENAVNDARKAVMKNNGKQFILDSIPNWTRGMLNWSKKGYSEEEIREKAMEMLKQ